MIYRLISTYLSDAVLLTPGEFPQPCGRRILCSMLGWKVPVVFAVCCCAHAESVQLAVAISDHAGVPPQVMSAARRHYERVFERAGIHLRWEQAAAGTLRISVDGPALVIHILSGEQAKCMQRSARCLGLALKSPFGRSVGTALVFYDRVTEERNTSLALTIGNAMAHETGHLLLGGRHSVDGVMKAEWAWTNHDRIAQGKGGFLPDQARSIRRIVETKQLEIVRSDLILLPSFCPDRHVTTSAAASDRARP